MDGFEFEEQLEEAYDEYRQQTEQNSAVERQVSCFCPKCHEEQFIVNPTRSGTGFDGENTIHWFEGDGKCAECGYEGYYSDSN